MACCSQNMPEYTHAAQRAHMEKRSDPTKLCWLTGSLGLIAAFLWGFAEGTLFFIIPDVLLTLTALFSFRSAVLQLFAAVSGALLAGCILFCWAGQDYPKAYETVMSVPYVNETMKATVHNHFDAHTTTGSLLRGSFSGIPYKLYAIEAPSRVDFLSFLLATLPARSARFLCSVLFFGAVGYWQRGRIRKNPLLAFAGHGIFWIIFYAIYWSSL